MSHPIALFRSTVHIKAAFQLLITAASLSAQLIISELYRDPPGGEGEIGGGASHEFIEITNLSSDTVRIDSTFITNGIESDSVIPLRDTLPGYPLCRYNSRILTPGASAVILDPDYRRSLDDSRATRFPFPANTPLFECGDAEFGGSGLAGDHGVLLYRGTRSHIDTILCMAADTRDPPATPTSGRIVLAEPVNREGVSLEAVKVLSSAPSFDYSENGITPGWYPPLHGGWLLEPTLGTFDPGAGSIDCTLRILCVGPRPSETVPWRVEALRAGAWQNVASGTLGLSSNRGTIDLRIPADSVPFRVLLPAGNTAPWSIDLSSAWMPAASVRITELFPKATSAEPEWFEIQNISTMPVNLKNWRFGNNSDTVVLTGLAIRLEAGEFAVVTKNSDLLTAHYRGIKKMIVPPSWHSLDNTRDSIMLLDGSGVVREMVCYDAAWFDAWPSLSLERNGNADGCDPSGWAVAQRASPGLPNAALYWRTGATPTLDIGPLPFSPDNDGSDDLLAIRLSLPAAATATIDIYGFDGRLLKRFAGSPQEVVYWDGRISGGYAPPGPFFVVARIIQGTKTVHLRRKGVLWRR